MIDLAPFLRGCVGVLGGGRMVILGPGVAFGLGVLRLVPGGALHGFGCRHNCLVDWAPIGSRGYATGVEFAAHLSKAGGFSQCASRRFDGRSDTPASLAWTRLRGLAWPECAPFRGGRVHDGAAAAVDSNCCRASPA